MRKVHIVGLRGELDRALEALYRAGAVELRDARSEAGIEVSTLPEAELLNSRGDELRALLSELDALLVVAQREAQIEIGGRWEELAGRRDAPDSSAAAALARSLQRSGPEIRAATRRLDLLGDERATLARYVEPLAQALPLLGELADLDETDLAALSLETLALVLETRDDTLISFLHQEVVERLDRRFELVWRRVDEETVVCLLAHPHREASALRDLLAHEQIRHVVLPESVRGQSLSSAMREMRRRLVQLPGEVAEARRDLRALLEPRLANWLTARAAVVGELARIEARPAAGVTRRTFVLAGWTPRSKVGALRARLERDLGSPVVVQSLRRRRTDEAPVLLSNPRPARSFESLVRLFELPRSSGIDPTVMLALILPLMFGLMVGDVIYGAVLLVIALWLQGRFARRSPMIGDIGRILALGSAWAIAFGFLFGEALGNLGRRDLGFEALWVYRASAGAIKPLFLLTLGLGGAHIVLGLALGIRQAAQDDDRSQLVGRAGTLAIICGAFALGGVALNALPSVAIAGGLVAIGLGMAAMTWAHGALGAVIAPVELTGAIANVLSYLRLAAVGLASAYLANVANEFTLVLPLAAGVAVAAGLHVLNLVLAAFSPMIQALRLHYVEFFSKFYSGGGHEFRPFGADPARLSLPHPAPILPGRT